MPTMTWKETRFLQVPLTPEESRQRGQQLANFIKERDELAVQQKAEKDRMKDDLGAVEGRIHSLARIVNEGVEERSVQIELRCDLGLGLIEEVRMDTGEIVKTREVTKEDKLRAQIEAQTEIPGVGPEPSGA